MCGISGLWLARAELGRDDILALGRRMTDPIRHRGPDADGHWAAPEHGIVLGHRRLAILDLSPTGAQPMASASGRFHMAFNGEIYNFRELREQLCSAGAHFRGTSDTEVLLAGFEVWGIAATIRRAHGMFALGVWDTKAGQLVLARDRLGEKPLYVSVGPDGLAFASELKSLMALPGRPRQMNSMATWFLLKLGYIPAPMTIWHDTAKVLPGQILTFSSPTSAPARDQYWSAADDLPRQRDRHGFRGTAHDAADELESLLRRVIRDEMVSDVPIGAFLSGGVDSSLVTALMQAESDRRIRTFTIGFSDERFDEAPFARAVAAHLGTEHTEVTLAPDEALQFVERLPEIYDEPFADSSQLPTLLVSHTTRQYVTVALSGDGGDELFSGYTQYRPGRDSIGNLLARIPAPAMPLIRAGLYSFPAKLRYQLFRRMRSATSREPVERLDERVRLALRGRTERERYEDALAIWPDPNVLLASAVSETPREAIWRHRDDYSETRMLWDTQTYLPDDICVKVDRAAMDASLEVRSPLLHHLVAEFAWSLPMEFKRRGDDGKLILKQLLARHVPVTLTDRPKRGFAVPLDRWLRGPLRPWVEELVTARRDDDLVNTGKVEMLWRAHVSGAADHGRQLWPVLMLFAWQRRWRSDVGI